MRIESEASGINSRWLHNSASRLRPRARRFSFFAVPWPAAVQIILVSAGNSCCFGTFRPPASLLRALLALLGCTPRLGLPARLLCHRALPFLGNSGLARSAPHAVQPRLHRASLSQALAHFLRSATLDAPCPAKCSCPPRPNVQPGSSSNYIVGCIPSSLHYHHHPPPPPIPTSLPTLSLFVPLPRVRFPAFKPTHSFEPHQPDHVSHTSHPTSHSTMYAKSALLALLAGVIGVTAYDPAHMPAKTDAQGGQTGYNDCQQRYGASNPKAKCQNVFINSVKDFCLWGPPNTQSSDTVGNLEAVMVAYCMKSGYGTRLIPDGTIKGAHFLKTPSFVQVTGTGDFTKIHIRAGDEGGELDPHGATGSGNPVGGHVFTRAFTGNWEELPEWQNFMSANEYCFRACRAGPWAKNWCPHIYDVMGCMWNEPANYDAGVFEQCDGIEGQWPGVYSGSTWYQGVRPTPAAQPAGKSSNCRYYPSISNGPAIKTPSKRSVMATQVKRSPEWEEDY